MPSVPRGIVMKVCTSVRAVTLFCREDGESPEDELAGASPPVLVNAFLTATAALRVGNPCITESCGEPLNM